MDSEFVNTFIARQKKYIDELNAKLILVETQYDVSQITISKLNEQLEKLKQETEKAQKSKRQQSE